MTLEKKSCIKVNALLSHLAHTNQIKCSYFHIKARKVVIYFSCLVTSICKKSISGQNNDYSRRKLNLFWLITCVILQKSTSSSAVNTVFTFVDRKSSSDSDTDTQVALAQLYAHVQSMPESTRKKKLLKQVCMHMYSLCQSLRKTKNFWNRYV